MEINDKKWKAIKKVFKKAQFTSFHFTIATVNKRGEPHVSPVGMFLLNDDMTGVYFEEFVSNTPKNYEHNKRVCVMAVNTGKWFWLKSLIKGKMHEPIGVRIIGNAGQRREANNEELRELNKLRGLFKWTKGYDLVWKNIKNVREIHFDSFEPMKAGALTAGLEV